MLGVALVGDAALGDVEHDGLLRLSLAPHGWADQPIPWVELRRSSKTTSRQRPVRSRPRRSWTPTRRKPAARWAARLAAFSTRIPDWSVHTPAASEASITAAISAPP